MIGKIDDTVVAVQAGRAHFYEGYSIAQVTFGVRVLGKLGIKSLVLTNAAGGINLEYSQGALVLISDHINLQGTNPLIGPNDDTIGPRFPDMSDAYSRDYRAITKQVARERGNYLNEGVYAGLLGPNYETPAEIRYLRVIGADLVGMSTVPEVIAARHMGVKCLEKSTKLRKLNLTQTKVTDLAMRSITHCRKLEELQLYITDVTDAGVAPLKDLHSLRLLDLRWTRVTDKGIKQVLPENACSEP